MAHTDFTAGGLEHVSIPLKLGDSAGGAILQQYSDSDEYFAAYCASLFITKEYDSAAGSADYLQAGAITTASSSRIIGSFTDTFYNEPVGTHPGTSLSVGSTTTTLNRYLGYSHQYGLSDWKLSRAEADYPGEFDSDNFFYNNAGNFNKPIGRTVFRNNGTTFDQLAGLVGVDSSGDLHQMEGFENLYDLRFLDSSPKGTYHDDDPLYQLADRLIVKMATEEYPGTFRLDLANTSLSADWVPYISNVFSDTTSDSSNSYNIFIRKSFNFPASGYGASQSASAMCIRVDSDANRNIEEQWGSYPNIGFKELDSAQMQTVFGVLCLHRRWQLDNYGDAVFSRDAPYGLDNKNTIGSYVLIDSAGPPPIYGTWAARGTAVDEIHQTQDQQHDRSYGIEYIKEYANEQYTRQYEKEYEKQYQKQYNKQYVKGYLSDYETDYSRYNVLYGGFAGAQYSGIPVGFTQYASTFSALYGGDYQRLDYVIYTGDYEGLKQSTSLYNTYIIYNKPYGSLQFVQYEKSLQANYTGTAPQNYQRNDYQTYQSYSIIPYESTSFGIYQSSTKVNYDHVSFVDYEKVSFVDYEKVSFVDYEKVSFVDYQGIPSYTGLIDVIYDAYTIPDPGGPGEPSAFYTSQVEEIYSKPAVNYRGTITNNYRGTITNNYRGTITNNYRGTTTDYYQGSVVSQYQTDFSAIYNKEIGGGYGKSYIGQYGGFTTAIYQNYILQEYDGVVGSSYTKEYSIQINYDRLAPIPTDYTFPYVRGYESVYTKDYEGYVQKYYAGAPVSFTNYGGTVPSQYEKNYNKIYGAASYIPYSRDYEKLYERLYAIYYVREYIHNYETGYGRLYIEQYDGETIISAKTTVNTYSLWQRVA